MTPARRKMLNISAIVAIVVALIGGAVYAGTAFMQAGRGIGQIQNNTDRIKIHEKKIHDIEAVMNKTHTDVEWIRKTMEREHP